MSRAPRTPSSFQFTQLTEPTSYANPTPPGQPFDAGMAYLLGQCCALTYAQFDDGSITPDVFSKLDMAGTLKGYEAAASNLVPFTVSEPNEPGPTTGDVGDYFTTQGGFGVQLSLTGKSPEVTFTVIALRGTRTFAEWLSDATVFPVPFAGVMGMNNGLGSVHSGFYGAYTVGKNGKIAASGKELSPTVSERAEESLAAQVGAYVSALRAQEVYVTGHSLGGALATLCALDVAHNFPASINHLSLYTLASPRVAVGISDSFSLPIPTLGNQNGFLMQLQSLVPKTFQIVHAADIVPIGPPLLTSLGPLTLSCLQVTDPWQVGSGATATAKVSGGRVTELSVNNDKSTHYSDSFRPTVTFSGGGGSGAAATAEVSLFGNVSLNLVSGGTGYSSPPTVTIVNSGPGLCENVVNFCAQTGDIGNNHGCVVTYVPYLKALANGFA